MKQIHLSNGQIALVDNVDFCLLSKYRWCYQEGYARRKETISKGKRRLILMHRQILHAPSNLEVDHIDSNGLNNQRCNLRLCKRSGNCRNANVRSDNTSGFKGVSFNKRNNKFRAYIMCNKVNRHIGYFSSAKAAAYAYDRAAKKFHGKFAKLNFLL